MIISTAIRLDILGSQWKVGSTRLLREADPIIHRRQIQQEISSLLKNFSSNNRQWTLI